ncbi:MAG: 16S rRNA (uracil(1498)-N(3))-methyltransferase [Oscillospiraceae bacterium]|nr:16S rRNA (uracil(1498)-N(3))-methyltransferase [Oscillospiraceae bacterium]
MSQFFVSPEQINVAAVAITGGDVNHIKNVLRKRVGDSITVSDGVNLPYICRITELSGDIVRAEIVSQLGFSPELPVKVTLFQGLAKGDKMDLIIQKTVELGVSEIVPVAMHNCVMRLDQKKADSRVKRWQAIAESAAKQSRRGIIPTVTMPMTFSAAMEYARPMSRKLLPYEHERGMERTRQIIDSCAGCESIGIFIGPEGGYTPEEVSEATESFGWSVISLGRRILRTETAGMCALSMLVYALDK